MCLASFGCSGYFRAALGSQTVVSAPSPFVGTETARGKPVGTDLHVDVTAGWRHPRVELGVGVRSYTGIDYDGRCATGPTGCQGQPFVHDLFDVVAIDVLVARVRLFPWRAKDIEHSHLSVMGTFNLGFAHLTRSYPWGRVSGISNDDDAYDQTGASLAVGAAASYALTRWLGIEVGVDYAAMWFHWPFEHLGFFAAKVGPVFRF